MAFELDGNRPDFASPPTQIVLHSTGAGNPASRVIQTLKGRNLAVHFICEADGTWVQCLDLKKRGAHIKGLNDLAIGIEFVNPLYRGYLADREAAKGVVREQYIEYFGQAKRTLLSHTKEQHASCVKHVTQLCDLLGIQKQVPMDGDGGLLRKSMTGLITARAFKGVLCHYHWHPTKLDAGTDLINGLRKAWNDAK